MPVEKNGARCPLEVPDATYGMMASLVEFQTAILEHIKTYFRSKTIGPGVKHLKPIYINMLFIFAATGSILH